MAAKRKVKKHRLVVDVIFEDACTPDDAADSISDRLSYDGSLCPGYVIMDYEVEPAPKAWKGEICR